MVAFIKFFQMLSIQSQQLQFFSSSQASMMILKIVYKFSKSIKEYKKLKDYSISYLFDLYLKYYQMQTMIYWQKQGIDRLCAVHSINALLQGPFFNEVTLAQFALQLDQKQKTLMLEQGMTKQAIAYLKQQSGNVAMDGYYSIQVLQQALTSINLKMISIQTLKSNDDLVKKIGFICNSSDHWFSLRKIQNTWYNLNSTNKRLPEIISDFYLSAFLIAVRNQGYQIFSVQGLYPQSSPDKFQYYNKNQYWLPAKRIKKYHQKCIKRKHFQPNINGAGGDQQMEKALALSLGKKYVKPVSSGEDSDWDNDEPKKKELKQFQGKGNYIGDQVYVNYQKFHLHQDDIQMINFLRQSLEEQYSMQLKSGKQVTFRYGNGKKQIRFFAEDALIQNLYDYIWHKRPIGSKFYLTNFSNKQKLLDVQIPSFALDDEDGTISIIVNDQ